MAKSIVLIKPAVVNYVLRGPGWMANVSDEDYKRLLDEGAIESPAPVKPTAPAAEAPAEGSPTPRRRRLIGDA